MKKQILGLLVFFISVSAFGQKKEGDAQTRLDRMNEKMKKELNLTDKQYEKVSAINADFVNAREANKDSESPEARKEAMKSYHAEMEKVLTAEQMEKFETQIKERRKKGGHGPKNRMDK